MRAASKAPKPQADLVPGPLPAAAAQGAKTQVRTAAIAARLAGAVTRSDHALVLVLAASERRAEEIGLALRSFTPDIETLVLPPWDTLPYDRASPSRACMGRRVAVLQRLAVAPHAKRIVVTSPDAVMQKLGMIDEAFDLARGIVLDRSALERFASRTGYHLDEQVDEPGDIALQGQVIDVFPADAFYPVRIKLADDGTIEDLQTFDVGTQRSDAAIEGLRLVPASELVLPEDETREPGQEQRLPAFRSDLQPLFALLPDATLMAEPEALAACERFADRAADAYKTRCAFAGPQDIMPPQPDHFYLTKKDLSAAVAACGEIKLVLKELEPTPNFAIEKDSARAFKAFVLAANKNDTRVAVVGLQRERELLTRMLKRFKLTAQTAETWRDVQGAEPGSILMFEADLESGFVDKTQKLAVVTGSDVFGARVASTEIDREMIGVKIAPQPGDVVVHEDHGVAILSGLEEIAIDEGVHEVVRLTFHGEAKLLVPTDELDRIWRYGSEPDAVTLDKLHTDGWNKRRVKINAFVEEAAERLVVLAAERAKTKTTRLKPDSADYARFAARFPFPETVDQAAAIQAVLDDLASGTPMNRLICGDVGYGKTEVALRAAAAVALCGKQVALIAPTTVLARQHALSFARRFAGTDIEIVHLSRLVSSGEAKVAKKQLATGKASIVIGTQMVTADDVDFSDLALVIVDEEHRFGTGAKEQLRALAPHHLALSATPIPRTLQGALVGVQDVSIIAAPPARRRPVRTFQSPFDQAAAATALTREKRRGGQSFVVVPRVEDIEPTRAMLKTIAPGFKIDVAHGALAAEEVDEAMVRFADGGSDILLATTLIENGLDVPRANTILIWGADRFGLAQLHQLRGRVGRGRVQGTAYLFTPDDTELSHITAERLAALIAADRLGAGFILSARDLDLRGGGDLVGKEQAGHMKLIGASLYQHLLGRAVGARKDLAALERRLPELKIDGIAAIPATYVPDEALRIELYARLAHLEAADALEAFGEELVDRFGDMPTETERLLTRRRAVVLAREAGVASVTVGPLATALAFVPGAAAQAKDRARVDGANWKDERLIIDAGGRTADGRLAALEELLRDLGTSVPMPELA
jgi:transcription-repair coupling factor (superfamily II helicase)